jgi:hypothetical protein
LALSTSGNGNTAVGQNAIGNGITTGSYNTAIGLAAGYILTSGDRNTLLGTAAGDNITTGSSNICIGSDAQTSAAGASNELVVGSNARFVATDGAANTFFTSATALSTGVLPVTCGFIKINLNGTVRKIAVYAV